MHTRITSIAYSQLTLPACMATSLDLSKGHWNMLVKSHSTLYIMNSTVQQPWENGAVVLSHWHAYSIFTPIVSYTCHGHPHGPFSHLANTSKLSLLQVRTSAAVLHFAPICGSLYAIFMPRPMACSSTLCCYYGALTKPNPNAKFIAELIILDAFSHLFCTTFRQHRQLENAIALQ